MGSCFGLWTCVRARHVCFLTMPARGLEVAERRASVVVVSAELETLPALRSRRGDIAVGVYPLHHNAARAPCWNIKTGWVVRSDWGPHAGRIWACKIRFPVGSRICDATSTTTSTSLARISMWRTISDRPADNMAKREVTKDFDCQWLARRVYSAKSWQAGKRSACCR